MKECTCSKEENKESSKSCEENEESGLDNFKKDYNVFKDKYNLPEFSELNEIFDIEEIGDCETEFLVRKIRRVMAEKIANYLRFIETILNPSNAPMFFFKLIKKLASEDKEKLGKIHDLLGKMEIDVVKLDLDYNEKKETEFINNVSKDFKGISKDLLAVVEKLGNGAGASQNNSSSYFG